MTNPLGLSADAKERRKRFITASDAKPIMEGAWPELWRRKMGLEEEENLDDELRVQMGSMTEPFNLFWFEKREGRTVSYYSDNEIARACWLGLTGRHAEAEWVTAGEDYPWMGCSLDALSDTRKGFPCVLDAKHVGQWKYDELVLRYTPGMVHQAICAGVNYWALAVFVANNRWEYIEQPVDVFYREDLIEREQEFWSWVERGEEPPDMSVSVAPPAPKPRLRNFEAPAIGTPEWITAVKQNNWLPDVGNAASQFAETLAAQKANGAARTAIKELLPADIGVFTMPTKAGVYTGKRSSAGDLTMTVKKDGE